MAKAIGQRRRNGDGLGRLGLNRRAGRHETREQAPGIEAGGPPRPYEFGDTLNLDVSETLFNAVRRDGAKVPVSIVYRKGFEKNGEG